ncbi:MAG: hypothetical protein FWF28_06340 [Micrococcales bacterium]|nr:hypothetical protein [Micrococcales bacterium]
MPIDFGSTRSSGINALAYADLIEYLGHAGDTRVFDMRQLLAEPDEFVRHRMGTDVVQLHRLCPSLGVRVDSYRQGALPGGRPALVPRDFACETTREGTDLIRDGRGRVVFRRPKGGLFFEDAYHPLADAQTQRDVDELLTPPSIDAAEAAYLASVSRCYFEATDYAIIGSASLSIFERGLKDFGYENFLVNVYVNRDLIDYYLLRMTEAYERMLDSYLAACGDYIQIIQANDDLGTQSGPLIDPKMYREVFKPWHARLFGHVKNTKSNIFVFLHSCGGIYDFIPDFIDAGADILNPIQTGAEGMDPYRIKREFGKDITLWGGGCDVQKTLPFGTVEQVRCETIQRVAGLKKGGGYVFAPTHNIQAGTSAANIAAMYDAALAAR